MMSAPYTLTKFPVVHGSGPMVDDDHRQMEEGRAMFAYWNQPNSHQWEKIMDRFIDLQAGRLLLERDQARERRIRKAVALHRLNQKPTDTPYMFPRFRADCFKRWIDRLTIWYLKRQQHKAEDYLFHTGRNHPSFS